MEGLRDDLEALLAEVADEGGRVLITREGNPAAVLVPPDWAADLVETIEILSDSKTVDTVAAALAESLDDAVDLATLRRDFAERRPRDKR